MTTTTQNHLDVIALLQVRAAAPTYEQLLAALEAVTPYAMSRAEDLEEYEKDSGGTYAKAAWHAVNNAVALLEAAK